jgi:hypothetical protein
LDGHDTQTAGGEVRETFFAPAKRATPETLAAQVAEVIRHPVTATILESFCGHVLVLNRERQILAASPEFEEALAACGMRDFVGKRPGEALGCEHAADGPGGCGTSVACVHCGAVAAILAAQCSKSPVYEECWIGMRRNDKRESVEFRAKATPLMLDGLDLVVLALHDISDQKRRRVLEQSLLHDARNLLGGIITWSEVQQIEPSAEAATSIHALALQLREHLSGHRTLVQAEKGELAVARAPLDLAALARALGEAFSRHPAGEGKSFVVRFPSGATPPISDQSLVLRILTNMVANALEASRAGATVVLAYGVVDGAPTFTVANPGVIPPEVVPRIFQRSFSTKSEAGHGLGTYSMRLLGEQYLGGRVWFTTSPEAGTTFSLALPAR